MNLPGVIIVASIAGWAAIARWLESGDRSIAHALEGLPGEGKPKENVHARIPLKTAA